MKTVLIFFSVLFLLRCSVLAVPVDSRMSVFLGEFFIGA